MVGHPVVAGGEGLEEVLHGVLVGRTAGAVGPAIWDGVRIGK